MNKRGESQENRGAPCCQEAPGIKMLFPLENSSNVTVWSPTNTAGVSHLG